VRLAPRTAARAANGLYVDVHTDAEVIVDRDGAERPSRGFDVRELAAIFAGGAVGGGIRTALAEAAPVTPGSWPWTTFTVNIVGCLLLGYFVTRLQERLPVTAYRRPLLGTGLCGGLTTFSTLQLEMLRMLDRGRVGLAVLYVAASLAAGFAGVLIGTAAVRRARLTW
jgi:fluoride exporter